MNNLLKLSFLIMTFLFLKSGIVKSQDPVKQVQNEQMSPEQKAEKRTHELTSKLTLDESQRKLVYEVYLNYDKNKPHTKEEMIAKRDSMSVSINAILTPDQQVKYKQLQEERKAQMKAQMKSDNEMQKQPDAK